MPMPTEERVSQLVAGLVNERGFDLEGVEILRTVAPVRVRIIVDGDPAADLDTLAEVSHAVSERLDTAEDFGSGRYVLEVTTPGVERPLTAPRHWRRARGRRATIVPTPGAPPPEPGLSGNFEARIGELSGGKVALILADKRGVRQVEMALADIDRAVVHVEFSPPPTAEWELAVGVSDNRWPTMPASSEGIPG